MLQGRERKVTKGARLLYPPDKLRTLTLQEKHQPTLHAFLQPVSQPSSLSSLHKPNDSLAKTESTIDLSQSFPSEKTNLAPPWPNGLLYEDAWDDFHVKLPCSPKNTYRLPTDIQNHLPKWELIKSVLQAPINNTKALRDAIYVYNPKYPRNCDFTGLRFYFTKVMDESRRQKFFAETLPFMVNLAISLPDLIKQPIPFLMQYMSSEIILNQHQLACLLANMFFCTFPNRSEHHYSNEYPNSNFNLLYVPPCDKIKQGKLNCILHYFERIRQSSLVSFRRQVIEDFPEWDDSTTVLKSLVVHSEGSIEDDGIGMLQVDFANKMIGGGILNHGCVQEEIRFAISPELIVSRLFTAEMKGNEAVIIKGVERFSTYSGYSTSFEWVGDYNDHTPTDDQGRINTEIAAIDALQLKNPKLQYLDDNIVRELNKAYAGFFNPNSSSANTSVATGNWGCGAFGGSKQLKSLLQLMAAAETGREVHYFTFNDTKFEAKLTNTFQLLVSTSTTVGELYQIISQYSKLVLDDSLNGVSLFDFIHAKLLGETDEATEPLDSLEDQ